MYFFVYKRYYKFLIFGLICNTAPVIAVSFLDSWYVFAIKRFWDIKFQNIKRISFQMQPTRKMIIIDLYYDWYDGNVVYQKSNILANIINDFCWSLFGFSANKVMFIDMQLSSYCRSKVSIKTRFLWIRHQVMFIILRFESQMKARAKLVCCIESIKKLVWYCFSF